MAYIALEDFNSGTMDTEKYMISGAFARHSSSVQHKTEGAYGLYYEMQGSIQPPYSFETIGSAQYMRRKEGNKFKISVKGDTKSTSGTSYSTYSSGVLFFGFFTTKLGEEIFGYQIRVDFDTREIELAVSKDDGTGVGESTSLAYASFVNYTGWQDLVVEVGANGLITVKFGAINISAIDSSSDIGGFMVGLYPYMDYKDPSKCRGQIAIDSLMCDGFETGTSEEENTNLVTDRLQLYYNYQEGVMSDIWHNIAPMNRGQYNAYITGPVLRLNGLYVDSLDDLVTVDYYSTLFTDFTIDFVITPEALTDFFTGIQLSLYVEGYGGGSGYYAGDIGEIDGITYLKVQNTNYLLGTGVTGFSLRYRSSDGSIEHVFPDGTTLKTINGVQLKIESIIYRANSYLNAIRYYEKALTDEEIAINRSVGSNIGLPSSNAPIPTIKSISKPKISDEFNMDSATVTFSFDQDVVQWSVNVLGVSYDTGIIADSGLNAIKNQDLTAVISFSELYREGNNRINIYGKSADGTWTPFVSDGDDSDDTI